MADRIVRPVDLRLAAACNSAGLTYSRYVDDITISGRFRLKPSGFWTLARRILNEHGFCANQGKQDHAAAEDGIEVTGVYLRNAKLDARVEYREELERQLQDAAALANGGEFQGPFFTGSQILGRIHFVGWLNQGRKKGLHRRWRCIDWNAHSREAKRRGLVVCKKKLVKKAS